MQKTNDSNFIDLQKEEDNYKICESCGATMQDVGCKMRCKKCGYFRSCSDLF